MQTFSNKPTNERQALGFPPDTPPFINNVCHLARPASNLLENHDLVSNDIRMRQFLECAIKPSLPAFDRDKYKFFREQLPMPQKRVLDVPGNRRTHWHGWTIRPFCTIYSEAWRNDFTIPDNWFGPAAPPHIC